LTNICPEFEYALAWHCAPSLAGIKPADLLSWQPGEAEWPKMLGRYSGMLFRKGIRLRLLGHSGTRLLILIYRPERLEACLKNPHVMALLEQAGYPVEKDMRTLLCHLRGRLGEAQFPHEIGLFLGYPPEDVEGFRRDGGRGCKLSGTWKVYGDVEQAQKQFASFRRCRAALTRRLQQGLTLDQVFAAA